MINFNRCAVIPVMMRSGAADKAGGPLGFEVLVYGCWTSELEQIRISPALKAIERMKLDTGDYLAPTMAMYNILYKKGPET